MDRRDLRLDRVDPAGGALDALFRVDFTPEGVERVDPPVAGVAMVSPAAVSEHDVTVVEEVNK